MPIDFEDKITNGIGKIPNKFFQSLIIDCNSKHDVQLNMQGLLYNPNSFPIKIIVDSTYGKLHKTLQPKQYFSLPYVYVNSIINQGNGNLEFYFTNSEFGEFSTSELVNVLGSIEITNDSINVSGNVNLTNDSINVNGSVLLTNDNINVSVTNDISANVTGSVNLTNDSINIAGSVNLTNDSININGSVLLTNDSINVNGSMNLTNDSVNISVVSQSDAMAINEVYDTFYINALGQTTSNYTHSSIVVNIALQPNSVIKIKEIWLNPSAYATHNFDDDTGMLQYMIPKIVLNSSGMYVNISNGIGINASIPLNIPTLKNGITYNNGLFKIIQPNNVTDSLIKFEYDRTVTNPGTSSILMTITWYLTNGNGTNTDSVNGFFIKGEISGSYDYSIGVYNAGTGVSSTVGSGSGSGGGCFTDDTEFYGLHKGETIIKKYKDFKIGDMILTINGFEPIEKLYDTGIQTVYIIDDNLKITDTQIFTMYNGDKEHTVKDMPKIVKGTMTAHTYDLHVKSLWIIPVCNKVYSLCDLVKKSS